MTKAYAPPGQPMGEVRASKPNKATNPSTSEVGHYGVCRMFVSRICLRFFVLVAAAAVGFAPAHGFAQAARTASKAADISVFGGFQVADPAYGPNRSSGGAFGVDFTRYFHIPVEPSLEIRANFNSDTYVSEHSYVFGLRAAVPVRSFKPYVDFLVGPGNIHFPLNVGYTGDNSTVYSYGGGVDIPVLRNFALKLDVQGQHWNTGEFTYTPTLGTVGIKYTIPFRPHVSQRDLGR